jgi:hypothetical protein
MVWTAIGLGGWAAWGVQYWWTVKRELYWANKFHVEQSRSELAEDRAGATGQAYLSERERASKYETAYNELRTRLEAKAAAKPADAIIHAKNSGDVRRAWDAAMANEQREMEN